MRKKALLSVVLSAVMVLGTSSPALAAGQVPASEVTAGMEASVSESQDAPETEHAGQDDGSVSPGQESVATQEDVEEGAVDTEVESDEADIEEGVSVEGSNDSVVAEKEGEDSKVEEKTDSAVEEEKKQENLVGAEGERVSVGENVTAGFDSETGTITFFSQGGTLSGDWKKILDMSFDNWIYGWTIDGYRIYKITISDDSDVMYLPEDCTHLFSNFCSLQSLDISKADTSRVTNMSHMFYDCTVLQTLDVSGFDTSNVTNMSSMFEVCKGFQALDLSVLDTSNVTDMSRMFAMSSVKGSSSLQTLDVSGFDTSNVTDMSDMFYECRSLHTLDVSGFDTSNVTNMGRMFAYCSSLQTLDLGGFDTSNVTDMGRMFAYCSSIQTLDLGGFDTSIVTDMDGMFDDCSSLKTLDISGFDMSGFTNTFIMFENCDLLDAIFTPINVQTTINLPHLYVDASGTNYKSLPEGRSDSIQLTRREIQTDDRIPVGENVTAGFDRETGTVTFYSQGGTLSADWKSMLLVKSSSIDGCAINKITISDDSDVMYLPEDCSSLFFDFCFLQSLDISKADTSRVTNMSEMFNKCEALQTVDVSGFDTSNVTDMSFMFNYCSSLQTLDLSEFDTSNVSNMYGMFNNCSSLQTLDISGFDMSGFTNRFIMFENCDLLETIFTPVNVQTTIDLPHLYVDVSGTNYNNLPEGHSDSIQLTRREIRADDRFPVGENVTAGFDRETGTVTFYSQGGTLSDDWESMLFVKSSSIDGCDIENITISDDSDVMYLPENSENMFRYFYSLKSLDFSKADTSNVWNMQSMFYDCYNLQVLDVSGFDTSSVTDMTDMFAYCSSLQTLNLSGFDMTKVQDASSMFAEIPVIFTPVNVQVTIDLPCTYVDASGSEYNSLPKGLSESIRLTKKGVVIPADLEILSLSDDYYGANGKQASFHIEAEGNGTISYQWQYRTAGSSSWKSPAQASAKTADYVFKLRPSYDNIEVRCIVSDESGNEIVSETRKANVFAYTSQPKDISASAGQLVNFEVSAIGRGITYQWYYMRPNSTWRKTTISGSKTAVLPITAGTKNDGTSYRCVITDEEGNKITSAAGTLTLEIPLQITGISEDAYDVTGESIAFHIDAEGNGNLSYQWQYKLAGESKWRTPAQASAKTADYIFKLRPSYDNIEVRCTVKDAAGNSATSEVRKANVFAITGQPQDADIKLGEKMTFAVEAVGRELVYQWYYMRPAGSWKKVTVAGYNTASLLITANTKNDGTMFRCLVKDVLGNTLTSKAATLTQ